jgi:hypothetical protein
MLLKCLISRKEYAENRLKKIGPAVREIEVCVAGVELVKLGYVVIGIYKIDYGKNKSWFGF